MTDDRFNELIFDLTDAVTITLAVNRLVMALRFLLDADPELKLDLDQRFESYVRECQR